MSGDGTGALIGALLMLPVLAIGAVIAAAGAIAYGTYAAGRAVYNYAKRRREQINIECDEMSAELAKSFNVVRSSINAQNEQAEIAYKKMLTDLDKAADEVTSYTTNLTQASARALVGKIKSKQHEIETIINNNEKEISRNYHNAISASVESAKVDMKRHYSNLMSDIENIKESTTERKAIAEKYANIAIDDAKQALDVLKTNYAESENVAIFEIKLNKAISNLKLGMGEVAFSTAHTLVLDILNEFIDADMRRRNHDAKVAEILTLLEHIKAVIDKERYISFEYNGDKYTEDLAEFSSGEYHILERICAEISAKLSSDATDNMTEAQLIDVLDEVEQLSMDVNNMFEFAVQNLANAYQREDVGDVIVEAMEKQGFVFEGHVNRANNRGESLYMKFTNIVGEEVVVKLLPEDDLDTVKTNIEVSMFNLSNPNDEQRKTDIRNQITDAITSDKYLGINSASMSCKGVTSCQNSTDNASRNFEEIKKMETRRKN